MSGRARRPTGPPRRSGRGEPKKVLQVFVEGKSTEEVYLTHLHRLHRSSVSVHIDERHGVPASLVEMAVRDKTTAERAARRGRGSSPAEYWCVFDRDEHPLVKESIQRALDNGINVAFSNPCMELWFVLHERDQTAYIHRHDVQRNSEAIYGFKKTPSDDALQTLQARYDEAKIRAQNLEERNTLNGSWALENPATTVWKIVDSISGMVP